MEVRKLHITESTHKDFVNGDFFSLAVHVMVISERVKQALEELNLSEVQYLPAIIANKKQGVIYERYFILHPYKTIKCMHKKLSRWTRGTFDPKRASEINYLVIDNEKLGEFPLEERMLFGLWENRSYLLFHKSVVDKILEVSSEFVTYPISKAPYM